MKESNKIIAMSAGAVALVAVAGLSLVSFAQVPGEGNGTGRMFGKSRLTGEEQRVWMEEKAAWREKVDAAMEQGYDAWAALIKEERGENAPILSEVTKDNFAAFQEAHGYMSDAHGLMEKARTTLEEAGIEKSFGIGFGAKKGFGRGAGCGMYR
jgi:hypothetical protein